MLQIEVICFGLAVEVERLKHQHQFNQQSLNHYNTCLHSILELIWIDEQRKVNTNQSNDINDLLTQFTNGKYTMQGLKQIINDYKTRSKKYQQIQELLDGQDINEVISKAEQYTIQVSINQELRDQLEEYPKMVSKMKEDYEKVKQELLQHKILVDDQERELQEINQKNNYHNREIESLKEQIKILESKQIRVDLQELEQLRKKILDLQNKQQSIEQEKEDLQEEIEQVTFFKTQMEEQIQELVKQNQIVLKKNDEQEKTLSTLQESYNQSIQQLKLNEQQFNLQISQHLLTIENLQMEVRNKGSLQIEVNNQEKIIEQLNERLNIHLKEIQEIKLQSQTQLNYELDQKNHQIEQIQKQLMIAQEEISKQLIIVQQFQQLRIEYEQRESQIKSLNQQLLISQQSFEQQQVELKHFQQQGDEQTLRLQKQCTDQAKKIQDLQQIISVNEKQITQCEFIQKESLQILQDEKDKLAKQLEDMKGELNHANELLSQNQQDLESYGNHIMELESDNSELQEQIKQKENEIDVQKVLNKKFQDQNGINSSIIVDLEEKIRQLEFQNSKISQMAIEHQTTLEELKNISGKYKHQSQELDKCIIQVQNLSEEKSLLQQQLQQTNINGQDLTDKYQKLEQINIDLEQQIYSMKFEINNYQIQITNLTQKVESSEIELRSAAEGQTTTEDQLKDFFSKIEDLEAKIQEQDQIIQEGNQKVITLQEDNIQLDQQASNLNKKVQEQEIFISQLQNELRQPNYQGLEEELQKLQIQYENLDTEYSQVWNQYQILQTEREQLLSNDTKLQEELDKQQKENKRLIDEVNQWKQQSLDKEDQANKKNMLIDKFNLKIMNLNSEICLLKKQVQSTEQTECSTAVYTSQIFELQQTIQRLKEQQSQVMDSQLENRLAELSRLNLELSKVVDERSGKVKTLQNEVEVYDSQIRELNQYIQNLEIQISDIRSQQSYGGRHQLTQNLISNQSMCSHSVQETPYSSDNEHDEITNKLQIQDLKRQVKEKHNLYQELKYQYETIYRQYQYTIQNTGKLQDYENKIALLSMEVSRYRNSSKMNSPYSTKENQQNVKTKEFQFVEQLVQDHFVDSNIYQLQNGSQIDHLCLMVLLFAQIESMRESNLNTQEEGKYRVQNIINYYRSRKQ